MRSKLLFPISLVLAVGLVSNVFGEVQWTDAQGASNNHRWMAPENWNTNAVPGTYDEVGINSSSYSGAPNASGPIIDANVGSVAVLRLGSAGAGQISTLKVVKGGFLTVKNTGAWPRNSGQMTIAQAENCAGTLEMTGGTIIAEGMCQLGKRPGQGLIKISGDAAFVTKDALKLGGQDRGSGDALIQLDGGTVTCSGLSMYVGESKIKITGGKLIAGPGRVSLHGHTGAGAMEKYIKDCVKDGRITAYDGKGIVKWELNSPQPDWITVWAVPADANSVAEPNSPAEPNKTTRP